MDLELGTPESHPSSPVALTRSQRKPSHPPPDTPERSRKRVARACDACRRLKEKCQGGDRCIRCARNGRECTYTDAFKPPRPQPRREDARDFLDPERIQCLEQIVAHYTGLEVFDKARLRRVSSSLISRRDATPALHTPASRRIVDLRLPNSEGKPDVRNETSSIAPTDACESNRSPSIDNATKTNRAYTGELSHWDFSQTLQRNIRSRLPDHSTPAAISSQSPDTPQLSSSAVSIVLDAASAFPPPEVASFLFDVFFVFGQTNYLYVDELPLRDKLRRFYDGSYILSHTDAPWVCTVLMMFAMGVQFSHLSSSSTSIMQSNTDESGRPATLLEDDTVARRFYYKASRLIPDVIAIASAESVQAFGLLAVYALPVDAAGLSCTYLGIAIKIATQNGMHLKYDKHLDPRQVEMRRRIWWTVYTLERRICVLHGRPVSITRSDVESDLPSNFPGLPTSSRIDTMPNVLAMIRLTDMLEHARDLMLALKRAAPRQKLQVIQSIVGLKDDLQVYWQSLPTETYCRDLNPESSLFRFNIHLQLTFHLVYIFIGRSHILKGTGDEDGPTSDDGAWVKAQKQLVDDCISSSLTVIDLCQSLDDEVGLARTSYTEFTSCCAAVLAVLAGRISYQDTRLRRGCDKGIKLLKKMSIGVFSNNSEKLAVEALEMAVQRLNEQSNRKRAPPGVSGIAYANFRNWATDIEGANEPVALDQHHPLSNDQMAEQNLGITEPGDHFMIPNPSVPPGAGFDLDSGYPEFDLGDFGSVPGLGDWFEFGLH